MQVMTVIKNCKDVFKDYELPFETYFAQCINHENEVHEEMELIWLIRGSAKIICDGKEYLLTSQTIFMIYMNKVHSISSSEDSIIISYRFKKDHLRKNNLAFETIPFMQRVYSFKELAYKYHEVPLLISQLIKLLITKKPSPIIRYKIIGYYNMYIYELYNFLLKEKYLDVKKLNYDEYLIRMNSIIEYTNQHSHKKISLEELSELTGVSTFRISHFVKEYLGISYREFLQNSRFENAIKRIKETKDSIAEIAKKSGFSDIKYLNQLMKEKFHMTALKYRKLIQERVNQVDAEANISEFIKELQICLQRIEEDRDFQDTYGLMNHT